MEKIKATIEWSGNNYSADAHSEDINGVVAVTHKTYKGIKDEFESALRFHIEGCLEDGDKLPEWVASGNYEIEYALEVSALLHSLDGILTRSAIARVSGINEKQIGHYASGHRTPRAAQRAKIVDGLHRIGKELAEVV